MRSLVLLPFVLLISVVQAQRTGESPTMFRPFLRATEDRALEQLVEQATTAEVDLSALQRLKRIQPSSITLEIPHKGSTVLVELSRTEVESPGSRVLTDQGEFTEHEAGVHYRGSVAGDPGSLAAFSFFSSKVIGVVSSQHLGDVVVGELRGANPEHRHVIYAASDLRGTFAMACGVTKEDVEALADRQGPASGERSDKCVRVYYELSDQLYANNNSDVQETMDWVTAVHNIVATLFANDGITIAMSDVFIWTTPMPFPMVDPVNDVNAFADYRTAFNGDVAICITTPGASGAAKLANLCISPYAGSFITADYEQLPLYSYTVYNIAHELGHVMGSPHTHDCTWNGNNTQIDDCGPYQMWWLPAGPCYDSLNAIIPPLGDGTIMSYCPASLVAGFGPQPAQRILDHITAAGCLGTDCITSCTPSIDSLRADNVTAVSAYISFHCLDTTITEWEIRILGPNMILIDDWTVIDTTSYTVTWLIPDGWHRAEVRTQCPAPFTGSYTSYVEFYVPPVACGDTITDSGVDGPYGNDCFFPAITIMPSSPSDQLTLTFSTFSLEPNADYLIVYNGPLVGSPILAYLTGSTVPAPITTPTIGGALTVAFTCDAWEPNAYAGWAYAVSCSPLATGMNDPGTNGSVLHVFPDPAMDRLNVEYLLPSAGSVELAVLDPQGRVVARPMGAMQQAGAHRTVVDLSALAPGCYLLRLGTNAGSSTTRFVKR